MLVFSVERREWLKWYEANLTDPIEEIVEKLKELVEDFNFVNAGPIILVSDKIVYRQRQVAMSFGSWPRRTHLKEKLALYVDLCKAIKKNLGFDIPFFNDSHTLVLCTQPSVGTSNKVVLVESKWSYLVPSIELGNTRPKKS